MYTYPDYLMHFGVKGMKRGVQHKRKKETKLARKDTKEYARAKMFYGEGSGNRRKFIRAKVNQRSKSRHYKSEFNKALRSQDMAKHAIKAKSERHRRDTRSAVGKTTRGIVNSGRGMGRYAGATVFTFWAIGHYTGGSIAKLLNMQKENILKL